MDTEDAVQGELLPDEYPDGTWLHLPDMHGKGYSDVVTRDDAEGHNDRRRLHDRHWWSFHRRAWIDWPDVVRHGGASSDAYVLLRIAPDPVLDRFALVTLSDDGNQVERPLSALAPGELLGLFMPDVLTEEQLAKSTAYLTAKAVEGGGLDEDERRFMAKYGIRLDLA